MQERPDEKARRVPRADADYHSSEDFVIAMRALPPIEIKRLVLQGRALVLGTTMTSAEPLNEAIRATADGERRWPKDVAIATYLYMVMKSVVSNARRKDAQLVHVPVGGDQSGQGDYFANMPDPGLSPEMRAILSNAEARAFALLESDELAQWLLLSRVEKETQAEFCQNHNLSNSEYEAVSKRLQRKLRSLKAGA